MAYSSITKPSDYFNTLIWTGSDTASGRDFTGAGFQPDLVWAKTRSDSNGHKWFDSVRGVGKSLQSEGTGAETTNDGNGYIDSFDADGFSSVAGGTNNYNFNNTSTTFAAWNWLGANGTASNTDGSITSTVSANTTSGFSIVSFTGTGANATVGHGLGATPKMIIVKNRDIVSPWWVYNENNGNGVGMRLNGTGATETFSVLWNNTSPTSSVFSLGSGNEVNGSGNSMIAYCFAEKKGFSKFGQYTGNGNADGTFIYTGFKPAMVIYKCSSTTNDWFIKDNKRETYNQMVYRLKPNSSNAEDSLSGGKLDFLSNGFKIRESDAAINASGATFIYMAFAENPLVTSSGIPATAR